jgi:hypothetical protein
MVILFHARLENEASRAITPWHARENEVFQNLMRVRIKSQQNP